MGDDVALARADLQPRALDRLLRLARRLGWRWPPFRSGERADCRTCAVTIADGVDVLPSS